MFKNIKFFNDKKNVWFILLILVVLGIALYFYSSRKGRILDNMEDGKVPDSTPNAKPSVPPTAAAPATSSGYATVVDPSELLPKDENSEFANLNPGNLPTPDLLQAGYHIGINTIGQTLKNPNYQLRSEPIIEKKDIGPWNISTIEPDYIRAPLEIGSSAK